jgi:hypothetical protein
MCPVTRRIKGVDEGAMMVLDRLKGVGLFKFAVRQTPLNFALGFDQVLPGLALVNVEGFDLQGAQNGHISRTRQMQGGMGDQVNRFTR